MTRCPGGTALLGEDNGHSRHAQQANLPMQGFRDGSILSGACISKSACRSHAHGHNDIATHHRTRWTCHGPAHAHPCKLLRGGTDGSAEAGSVHQGRACVVNFISWRSKGVQGTARRLERRVPVAQCMLLPAFQALDVPASQGLQLIWTILIINRRVSSQAAAQCAHECVSPGPDWNGG